MIRVGINGWDRIGKMVFKAALQNFSNLQIVGINDSLDPSYIACMLRYDSVHGRFKGDVAVEGNDLMVNDNRIRLTAEKNPADLRWGDLDTDVVVESSGLLFRDEPARTHIAAGAKKVILTVPAHDDTPMFVYGVNDASYLGQRIISNASPSIHGLALLAKVLDDHFGIKRGLTTFLRATTLTRTVDSPFPRDWRGGRGILENIIPSSTGAAKAVGKVIPRLNGRLTGMAFRIPTSNVSVVDLTVELEKETTYQEITTAMKQASQGSLKGVLGYTEDDVVATDFRGEPCTAVFDAKAGIALDATFFKVVAWYDNEWGYSNKLCEMAQVIAA